VCGKGVGVGEMDVEAVTPEAEVDETVGVGPADGFRHPKRVKVETAMKRRVMAARNILAIIGQLGPGPKPRAVDGRTGGKYAAGCLCGWRRAREAGLEPAKARSEC